MSRADACYCIVLLTLASLFFGWANPIFWVWVIAYQVIHNLMAHNLFHNLNPTGFWVASYLLTVVLLYNLLRRMPGWLKRTLSFS